MVAASLLGGHGSKFKCRFNGLKATSDFVTMERAIRSDDGASGMVLCFRMTAIRFLSGQVSLGKHDFSMGQP